MLRKMAVPGVRLGVLVAGLALVGCMAGCTPGAGGLDRADAAPNQTAAPEGSSAPGEHAVENVFPVKAGEIPMWGRDASRNMVNPVEKGIPATWDIDSGENVKWVTKLGSQSYGNPAIRGGKIFVGTNNGAEKNPDIKGDKGVIMCLQQSDGKFLWQAVHDKLAAGRVNDWPEQGICSSPLVDGGKVYYVSNRAEVVCADVEGFQDGENDGPYKDEKYTSKIDGDFIWVVDMVEDLGVFPHNIATSSPLVVNDAIYVLTSNGVERDHITVPSPRSPSFIALNKHTGELIWESREPGKNILHGQWAAPGYVFAGGRPQILMPGGDGILYSLDPLHGPTGKVIWKFDCNPKDSVWKLHGRGTRNSLIATPVSVGETVYIAVGQDPEHGEGPGHLYALDASKTGDITESGVRWHYGGSDFRRTLSTVAVNEDRLYAVDLSGFLHCLDKNTGKPHWVHDTLAAVWGSPKVVDGKVFLGDEDGEVVVLADSTEKKVLGEMYMNNSVYSTPVAAGGVLYVGTRSHLYAIAAK